MASFREFIRGFFVPQLHVGVLQYQADWVDSEMDTNWYPAGNFEGLAQLLEKFHAE